MAIIAVMSGEPALLAVVTRSGRVEAEHRGNVAVCDASGNVVHAFGDPSAETYSRSAAKPFQAITCLLNGAADKFGWTDEELAVVCGSHSGEPRHLSAVRSLLAKSGLTEDALQCGPHMPFSEEARDALIRADQPPAKIHNNCSGKHSGMLACCLAAGWPIEAYCDAEHPLQRENVRTLARFAGLEPGEIGTGTDGCGVPSFYLPIRSMATAFARLASPEYLAPPDQRSAAAVYAAMTRFPYMIAGAKRLDTFLGEFAGIRLVAKVGGEGVACVGVPEARLGFAVKVVDGSTRALPVILAGLLRDILPDLDWNEFVELADCRVLNTLGATVGNIEARF